MIVKSYEIEKKITNFFKYNFFLLYGENEGLKKHIKESLKNILNQKETDIEELSLFENEIIGNEENFYNTVFSSSLFSKKKLITIHNATDKITKQIKDILNKQPENILIVIFSNILEKKSKLRNIFEVDSQAACIACYLDNNRDLEMIARMELKKKQINVSNEIISLLVEKSNNDRNNLKNEIEKIKSFSLNKKNLEVEEIKSLINFSGEYKSENFVNECLCGNVFQYKKIMPELYSNTTNHIYLLRILSKKIQRLLNIKKLQKNSKNIEHLVETMRPPVFWKEKPLIKRQLTIWSLDNLKKIIYEINDTEVLCKKNPKLSKIIFFNFFSSLCNKAKNFS